VRAVPGDITKPETLRPGARGVDVVFHLAAWRASGVKPKDLPRLARINVDGTRAVLEAAASLGVPRIVYTSSVSVFESAPGRLIDETAALRSGPFESEYEHSKHRALVEVVQPLLAQGLPLVVVCPTLVYGPGDSAPMARLLRAYAARRLPLMAGAESGCGSR
jgi:nucleoside-diphosphate-sugar epimerase